MPDIGGLVKGGLEALRKAITGEKERYVLIDKDTGLQRVLFNATFEYSRDYQNTITDHAVEEGVNISDHVSQDPDVIAISGLLTDSDLTLIDPTSFFDETVEERRTTLLKWKDEAELLTLMGGPKEVTNLLIQGMSERKSLDVGPGLAVDLTLKQVRIMGQEIADTLGNTSAVVETGAEALPLEEVNL